MAATDYSFVTRWLVPGDRQEVYDILGDPLDLPRWWREVYLKVEEVEAGAPDGVGRVINLHTKGWLPYTLHWSFRVTEVDPPKGFALEAWGDFVGQGRWTFNQLVDRVDVVYEWEISVDKPLLRNLSFLLKPVFAANHRWAMKKGEAALKRELFRRRAGWDKESNEQDEG